MLFVCLDLIFMFCFMFCCSIMLRLFDVLCSVVFRFVHIDDVLMVFHVFPMFVYVVFCVVVLAFTCFHVW